MATIGHLTLLVMNVLFHYNKITSFDISMTPEQVFFLFNLQLPRGYEINVNQSHQTCNI